MQKKIKLYSPTRSQMMLHDNKCRFKVFTCGRRWGKTLSSCNELAKFAWENPFTRSYWCSPTYRQSRVAFRMLVSNFNDIIESSTRNPMEIVWRNGSTTQFASTDSVENLRGDSCSLMVIDEASMIPEEAWTNVLRPMLTDTNGRAIIISTPKGRNWFWSLFQRGQSDEFTDYASFQFPTSSNPYIPASEIEEVRNSLPYDVFRQEYQAEFLEDGSGVFRGIHECIRGELEEPNGGSFVCGFDVAKHSDFSCVVVMESSTGRVVGFDRFNRIDYSVQVKRVEAIARKYNAKILMDSTGVGDPILEQVKALGLQVEGYQFTNTSKQQLIEHLAVLIEKQEISFPNIKVLINELMSYQYEITRAGNMRYNAPSGMHDDCVIALALAAWGAKHQKIPRVLHL